MALAPEGVEMARVPKHHLVHEIMENSSVEKGEFVTSQIVKSLMKRLKS